MIPNRVMDALLGNARLCHAVRRTDWLARFDAADLASEASRIMADFDEGMIRRAVNYLYTKETRSSFDSEGEHPSAIRPEGNWYDCRMPRLTRATPRRDIAGTRFASASKRPLCASPIQLLNRGASGWLHAEGAVLLSARGDGRAPARVRRGARCVLGPADAPE